MNDILYLFKPSTVTVDDSCTFYIAYDLMSKATTRHPQSLYEKYKNKASCKWLRYGLLVLKLTGHLKGS